MKEKIIKYLIIFTLFLSCFLLRDIIYGLIGTLKYKDSNEQIKVKLEVLKSENYDLKAELNKIKTLYNLDLKDQYNYVLSNVSIRNPYTFYNTLIINSGTKDNIKKEMAVITENGLVGKISEVSKNSSKVDLITNPQSEISVIVHNSYGILAGYSKKDDTLIIKNINNYTNIEEGDLVYTSGLGQLPHGILIGKVEKIEYDRFQIEQSLYVKSKVNFNSIDYVAVIINEKENES